MRLLFLTSVLMACRNESEKTQDVDDIEPEVVDADGDGFSEEDGDCDDRDAQISPNAVEICDGFDNNCDGEIDEGVTQTFFADLDGDGFGNPDDTIEACDILEGYVVAGSDCDDDNATIFPSAEELCDGLDNDCDETIDEDVGELFYIDADGDGVGDSDQVVTQCDPDLGLASVGGDCDDNDPMRTPNAFEVCDGIDNDCDEEVDEGVMTTFYIDADEDGFGDLAQPIESCTQEQNYATNADDCDDIDPMINPLADEVCDEQDNDCDGFNNEAGALGETVWYEDTDGDGYGNVASPLPACDQPTGYVDNYDDCNDGDVQTSPNAFEVCDGIDNNCDGTVDEPGATGEQLFYADLDGDTFGDANNTQLACTQPSFFTTNADDCNDANATVYPGATEVCDSLDNDCDGDIDTGAVDAVTYYLDTDGDGYGGLPNSACTPPISATDIGGDCDDLDAAQNLDDLDGDGYSTCDGDCDDLDTTENPSVTWYADSDNDGFGDPNSSNVCARLNGTDTLDDSDCNDADPSENPAVIWYADNDGDGFGDALTLSVCSRGASSDVIDNTDCDDSDSTENPTVIWYADGDEDTFGDASSSNVCERVNPTDVLDDTDCDDGDETENPNVTWYADTDGDGFGNSSIPFACERNAVTDVLDNTDCDDADSTENPNVLWYADGDGDTFGDASSSNVCERLNPTDVLDATDCNDSDSTENPNVTWYADTDGDGFGDALTLSVCSRGASSDVLDNTDCDDGDATENPNVTWYADSDNDGFGDPNSSNACEQMASTDVLDATDCDDTDSTENPNVTWYADNDGDSYGDPNNSSTCTRVSSSDVLDNTDCDDSDSTERPGVTWYADNDGDSFGNPISPSVCARASIDDVLNNSDCDDTDSAEYPGVVWYTDADGDSYGSTTSGTCDRSVSSDVLNNIDCDDSNAFLTPADVDSDGVSTCSGDCDDGDASLNQTDSDEDGYTTCDGDCNDTVASVSPVGVEDCVDGLDNDCNGIVDDGPVGTIDCPANACSDVETGLAYVDQGLGGGPDWYYCENDTDGGGWTLAYWNSYGHHATTTAVNRSSLGDLSTHAKLVDSEIAGIATAGFGEVMVKDHHSTTIYIKRYTTSAWSSFSSTGWKNQSFESMNSSGNWQTGCNGHRNNRGISTYSDNNGSACPIVYQGSTKYFVTWHTSNYTNGVGGEFGVYVR